MDPGGRPGNGIFEYTKGVTQPGKPAPASATAPAPARAASEATRRRWIAAAFVLLVALGMARHEMWRDELQAWAIARASPNLPALFANLRYEGHPALWHLLLWPLAHAAASPVAMQGLHLAIVALAGWLFLRWAPFPLPLRGLFLFGYLPLFEHGVVSRNYALALPALWGACRLWTTAPRRWLMLGACIALLANANPYAWLLAAAIAAVLTVELVAARRPLALLGFLALAGAGLAVALWQMLPPPDALYASGFHGWSAPRFYRTLGTVLAAYVPLPDPTTVTPWNSALVLHAPPPPTWAAALSPLWLAAAWWLLAERRARALFAIGSAALLAFTYFVYVGFARHHGHHVLLFVACGWLALVRLAPAAAARRRLLRVLAALLVVHLATAAWLFGADLVRPFSGAKAAAARLASPALRDLPAFGLPDPPLVAVGAYRGAPVRSLASGEPVVFVRWRADDDGVPDAFALCTDLALAIHRAGGAVALVLPAAARPATCPAIAAQRIGRADPPPLVPSERLATWRVTLR